MQKKEGTVRKGGERREGKRKGGKGKSSLVHDSKDFIGHYILWKPCHVCDGDDAARRVRGGVT